MKIYTYPLFYRLIYRFGNIPATILLLTFFIPNLLMMEQKWYYTLYAFIVLFVIYALNRWFFRLYRIVPMKIEVSNHGIICSDFFFDSKKKIFIPYSSIKDLRGGVFEGVSRGLMRVIYEEDKEIGFFHSIKGASKLESEILSQVNKPLYDKVLSLYSNKKKK